jgi:hypothetical protein
MPLSEHEQRLLEQMEKALYAEDPKFATALRQNSGTKPNRGRAALGVIAFLLGVLIMMVGAVTNVIAVGVLGFVIMLMGALLTYAGFRAKPSSAEATGEGNPRHPSTKRSKPGRSSRLEDRWRRRRDHN